jgi:hypothetical protein
VSYEYELGRKFVFLQVFTPLDVVAIAIAASGTPTKVSSNMRVSVKKTHIFNRTVAKLFSYRY